MRIFNLGDDGSEIKGNVKCAHGRVEWLNLLHRGGAGVPDTRKKGFGSFQSFVMWEIQFKSETEETGLYDQRISYNIEIIIK